MRESIDTRRAAGGERLIGQPPREEIQLRCKGQDRRRRRSPERCAAGQDCIPERSVQLFHATPALVVHTACAGLLSDARQRTLRWLGLEPGESADALRMQSYSIAKGSALARLCLSQLSCGFATYHEAQRWGVRDGFGFGTRIAESAARVGPSDAGLLYPGLLGLRGISHSIGRAN